MEIKIKTRCGRFTEAAIPHWRHHVVVVVIVAVVVIRWLPMFFGTIPQ